MARIIRFSELGGPEVLRIADVKVPPAGPGEVRIATKALGLNRAEALLRRGSYIETASLPSGLGLEAAGIVESVGAGVDGIRPGDAVSLIPPRSMLRWPLHGELGKSLTLRGYLVHEVTRDPDRLAAAIRFILDGVAAGALRPVIARRFPLDEIVEAHRYLESNAQFGKIVVTV